jgi:hypothetical protein
MRPIVSSAVSGAAVLAALLLLPGRGNAQNLQSGWGWDAGWSMRPGANVPYDGLPYSERYGYYSDPYWWPFPRTWQLMYEIDREERAEVFGTRYGPGHPPLFNRLLDRHRH